MPSLRLFSEGTKWSKRCGNSGGISPRPVCSRGFRPKFVPDSLAPASCPVDIPFFQHTKHGKFFFVQISSVTETTRRQFFREKKKMIGRPGPQPHEVAAVAPVGTSSSFFRQLGVSAGGRWQQNDAQRHFHKIRSTLI